MLKKLNITPYNTLLTILFFGGLLLTIVEIGIYHHTFISYVIPTGIWFLVGLIMTPLLSNVLSVHYNTHHVFWQFVYNLCTWGGIGVYLFMACNFYFAKAAPVSFKSAITVTGHLAKGTYGCAEPYVDVMYNGIEKQVIFACGTPVENYRWMEMKIEKGFFGFDVIKGSTLLDEKKGAKSAFKPADYNIYFDSTRYQNTPLELKKLGDLVMPTGKIVVGDPLTSIYDSDPLKREIAPGKYPVIVCVANTGQSGERYAVAKLEISKARAVKWELALTAKQRLTDLKGDQTFGFPVDAGLGCFVDKQTRDLFNQYDAGFRAKDKDWNIYDGVLAAEFKKNAADPNDPNDAGDWVNFYLPNKPDLNIIMFQSGYGDGYYASYWGLDSRGQVCSLVIDFAVLGED